jgi:hypothetical protein
MRDERIIDLEIDAECALIEKVTDGLMEAIQEFIVKPENATPREICRAFASYMVEWEDTSGTGLFARDFLADD